MAVECGNQIEPLWVEPLHGFGNHLAIPILFVSTGTLRKRTLQG
jgi:hypothetical protein